MPKIVLGIVAGIGSLLLAVYFGFLFISGQADGSSPLLLVPSAFLVAAGGYSFFKVFRHLTARKPANDLDTLALEPVVAEGGTGKSMLDRNNSLIADYKKTTETQDKLKMLQAAGAAEEGK